MPEQHNNDRLGESDVGKSAMHKASEYSLIASILVFLCSVGYQAYLPIVSYLQRVSVKCDAVTYDFGERIEGDTIEHTFYLTNTGNRHLTIREVKLECGCTTVKRDLRDRVVRPLETLDIPVVLRVDGSGGRLKRSVAVSIEQGGTSEKLMLLLTGVTSARWNIRPAKLVFHHRSSEDDVVKRIELVRNPNAVPARITSVNTSGGVISAELEDDVVENSNGKFTIAVRVVGDEKKDIPRIESAVHISESDDGGWSKSIPVSIVYDHRE